MEAGWASRDFSLCGLHCMATIGDGDTLTAVERGDEDGREATGTTLCSFRLLFSLSSVVDPSVELTDSVEVSVDCRL